MLKSTIGATALLFAFGSAAWAADGADIFKDQCAKCHGDTGLSDTPSGKKMKIDPIAGNAEVAAASVADLAKGIKEAKKHPKAVKGLSDDDVTAVATFTKKLAGGE